MESKSGENLEAPIKINFTTVAAGKAVENPKQVMTSLHMYHFPLHHPTICL